MSFDSRVPRARIAVAEGFAELLKPQPGPRELDAQYGQPDRNDDESRPRRYQHDCAQQNDRYAHYGYDDSPCELVGQVDDSFDHDAFPGTRAAVGTAYSALMIVL